MIFPFTFIMLVDWIMVQRRSTPAEEFFERPRTLAQWINAPAVLAFFIGLAFNLWIHLVLPAGLVHQVPIPYVGALISAGLYALVASRSPHSMRTATGDPGTPTSQLRRARSGQTSACTTASDSPASAAACP